MHVEAKLAYLGTTALLGFSAIRGLHAHAAAHQNKVYTSIRQELELNQLLSLPNPLLVNFCMYTDPKSKAVSEALKKIVESQETHKPVSSVDVEVDEAGTRELLQRYLVSRIPTIVALEGGERVDALEPSAFEPFLENEINHWIKSLN